MGNTIYRFGIIGTGAIANIHAEAIKNIENTTLVGAYNRTREKADNFGQLHSCASYSSIEELIAADPDIICICTASGMHLEHALQCIEAGKHCLIEKPLEINSYRSDLIIQAAEKNQVYVGVVFPSRFYPVSKQIKRAVDTKRLGHPVLGSAYVKWNRDAAYYASAPWRGTWALDGGGALMNQAIHSVDLLQWYMGPVKSVQALTANIRHQNIEVEDTAVALLRFANGAVGTLECSTATYPGSFKRIELHGTDGTVILEENNLQTWQFKDEIPEDAEIRKEIGNKSVQGGVADPMDISYYGHQLQIIDFLNAISTNTDPLIDAKEGKKSVEIIEAIYKSSKEGKEVTL